MPPSRPSALPESELLPFIPEFEAPANYKDAEKIKVAIEAKKKDWLEDAALDPMTGQVLCIGLLIGDKFRVLGDTSEAIILHEFWETIHDAGDLLHPLIGFNIFAFDLPFLIRRSWKHGATVPLGIRRGRYWGDQIIDLRSEWQLGDRQAPGSLDTIAKHLGVGAKIGNGKDFAALWEANKDQAISYLRNDLELCGLIAKKLGVLK